MHLIKNTKFITMAFTLVMFYSPLIPIHANPNQKTMRSGGIEDADVESPLGEDSSKYILLLQLSNEALEKILHGEESTLFDTKFSLPLKEMMDRSWFLLQFSSLRTLYGQPTAFKKKQWYFVEERIQGKEVVHSIKFLHFGNAVVQIVITVPADNLLRIIGFRIIPPRREALSQPTAPDFSSADQDSEDAEKPLEGPAAQYAELLKTANAFLECLKASDYGMAYETYIATDLKTQTSLQQFEEGQKMAKRVFGPIETFRANQWTFRISKYQNNDVVILQKIVHHTKATVVYSFVAYSDQQTKLIGFQVLPQTAKSRAEPPETNGNQ